MLKPGQSLRFALMPQGQDPDDLLRSEGQAAIKTIIDAAEPMIEMLWRRALQTNDRSTPERQAQFERALEEEVQRIGDPKVKQYYAADVRRRVGSLFGTGEARRWRPRLPGMMRKVQPGARLRGRGWSAPKPWEVAEPAFARAQGSRAQDPIAPGGGAAGTGDPPRSRQPSPTSRRFCRKLRRA